jgi:hypothetical protein
MAEQHGTTPPNTPNPSNLDPMTAFWRDVWARSAASMPNMSGMAGMPGMSGMPNMSGMPGMPGMTPDAAAAFMTPEAMKRMQSAFFESMAQYAEQYMRSPQFLESMKRSMDQALQLRRQMDDFLKFNMASAFESATGGSNSEILGAIRQSHEQLKTHIDGQLAKLEARVSEIESAVTGSAKKPGTSGGSAPKGKSAKD